MRVYVEPCSNHHLFMVGGVIGCDCAGYGYVRIHYCPECGNTQEYEFVGTDDDGAFRMSCADCGAWWHTHDPRWLAQVGIAPSAHR